MTPGKPALYGGAVPSWHEQGSCAGQDPRWWDGESEEDTRRAVQICWSCPVWSACREDALQRGEPHLVWGGLTAQQRERLRKGEQHGRQQKSGLLTCMPHNYVA